MAALSRIVGGARTSTLVRTISAFDPNGTLPNEDSRVAYTTATGTHCTQISAHGQGIQDNYHKLLLIVPNTVDLSNQTPRVSVFHGVGNDEGVILPGPSGGKVGQNGLTDSWLDQGWTVMSFNLGGVSWGNESSRQGVIDCDTWYTGIFNSIGPFLYGVSMGACAALNYLLDVFLLSSAIRACALNSAATNFQYTYDHSSALVGAMRTAYGLAPGTPSSDPSYTAAVDTADGGHDPQKQTAGEYPSIPFAFYTGGVDTTISKPNNTDLFVTKLTNASWTPEIHQVVVAGANHAADSLFQPADTLSFFQRALP